MVTIDQYLQDLIDTIDRKSTVLPDGVASLQRNTLGYLWLAANSLNIVQSKADVISVPLSQLIAYLGNDPERVRTLIRYLELGLGLGQWIRVTGSDEHRYVEINYSDLQKVEDKLNQYYGVTENVPFMNMTGAEFINALYNRPPNPQLFDHVLSAFREAFNSDAPRPNIETTPVTPNVARIRTTGEDWYFMLAVFQSDSALEFFDPNGTWDTMRVVSHVTLNCYYQQRALDRLSEVFNTLLILPLPGSTDAYNHIVATPFVYRITPLDFLAFLRGISGLLRKGIPKSELARRLDDMFPNQTMWHFGVGYALRILEGIEPSIDPIEGYIVPVCYNSEQYTADNMTLQFGYERATGRLKPDPEYLKHSPALHSISIDGKRYTYRVSRIDIAKNNSKPSEYAYAPLEEIHDISSKLKLSDVERRVVQAAFLEAQSGD